MHRSAAIVLSLLLFAAGALTAQSYKPGPQVLTFFSDVDDSDQPYALYLPKAFDPSKKYPLVVSLHGAGSNHRLNLRRVFGRRNLPRESDEQASRYFPALRDVEFIVASPLARGSMGYWGIAEKDVYDMLADVRRRFPVDDDRVYLTGHSMGGGGALWFGLTRPGIWAALAPVCAEGFEGADELAPNALNLPVHLFHGDADPVVPVASSRAWHKRLLELDSPVEYVEYPGVRHNAWDFAYRDGGVFSWFAKHRRNRFPDRVRFVSRAYKYSSAYWVELDGLTPGQTASIDARFTAVNRIEIRTAGLDAFTLNLEGHPKFSAAQPLRATIDGVALTAAAKGRNFAFRKTGEKWRLGRRARPASEKRPDQEGPIGEAIAARHLYVYGAADSPPPDEVNRRLEAARKAAEWSTPRLRLFVSFRVAADHEVTDVDLQTSNLVLLGTKETNSAIAKFADRLPMELSAGAADYGLVFVAPAGEGRVMLVNSGLPWWTGAEQSRRGGLKVLNAPYAVLPTMGDYMVFKGSLENVVAEGRFDRNWSVPADAAPKIRATGAVTIR